MASSEGHFFFFLKICINGAGTVGLEGWTGAREGNKNK